MNDPTVHTIWAGVATFALAGLAKLAYACLPWFARQGEKLVDAWCKRIDARTISK